MRQPKWIPTNLEGWKKLVDDYGIENITSLSTASNRLPYSHVFNIRGRFFEVVKHSDFRALLMYSKWNSILIGTFGAQITQPHPDPGHIWVYQAHNIDVDIDVIDFLAHETMMRKR